MMPLAQIQNVYLAGAAVVAIATLFFLFLLRRNNSSLSWEVVAWLCLFALVWPLTLLILVVGLPWMTYDKYRERRQWEWIEQVRCRTLNNIGRQFPELDDSEKEAAANLILMRVSQDKGQSVEIIECLYSLHDVTQTLAEIWEPPTRTEVVFDMPTSIRPRAGETLASAIQARAGIYLGQEQSHSAEPANSDEWGFHLTDDFRKCVKCLDKNLRGRVLDAITEICMKPMELRGDTVKPLTGELQGFWRYRLGDYRLIYHPDPVAHRIDLVSIGGRGQIYA